MLLAGDDEPITPLVNVTIMNVLLPHATLHDYEDGHLGLVTSADTLGPLASSCGGHRLVTGRRSPGRVGRAAGVTSRFDP